MSFRKAFKIMKTTDCSRVYKLARRYLYTSCSFCKPHRGDNQNHHYQRNWKKYRKSEWRKVRAWHPLKDASRMAQQQQGTAD